jgi:antitoxin component of MazEF toxin-antitoxin module
MAHKNIRRIIRAGNTSLAVIIPKDWLRFHELDHGDQVEVISNGSVMIKPIQKGRKSG